MLQVVFVNTYRRPIDTVQNKGEPRAEKIPSSLKVGSVEVATGECGSEKAFLF